MGRWRDDLDKDDKRAFDKAKKVWKRVRLHEAICAAEGHPPFSLTALKDCLNARCICR